MGRPPKPQGGPSLMDLLKVDEKMDQEKSNTAISLSQPVLQPPESVKPEVNENQAMLNKDIPKLNLQGPGNYTFADQMSFAKKEDVICDTETTGLGRFDTVIGVGFLNNDEKGTYIPYAHKLGPNVDRAGALEHIMHILHNPSSAKFFFNLKYDLSKLVEDNIIPNGELHDVMVMASLLDENRSTYQLKSLAETDLGMPADEQNELKRWLLQNGFKDYMVWEAPAELVGKYCFGDVLRTKRLKDLYYPQIKSDPGLLNVYKTECAISPILLLSEKYGVHLDKKALQEDKVNLSLKIAEGNRRVWDITGSSMFNFNSTQHLATQLTKWEIPVKYDDKTKNPCLDASEVDKIKVLLKELDIAEDIKYKADELLTLCSDLRSTTTYLSTFIQQFLDLEQNGRIYFDINQLRGEKGGAVTGRMSYSPNMQNIPQDARHYFIPDNGKVWLSIDYSQIEYRLFAHYAQDKKLIKAYNENPWTDYHQVVADLLGIDRKPAKNMNFGLLYAMGKQHLADSLGLPLKDAEVLFEKYHAMFPSVKTLRRDVENTMKSRGFIKNLFGRRRHIADSRHTYRSLNSLIQGSAADLFKHSLKRVYYEVCHEMQVIPLLYVHDEYVFQLDEAQIEPFLKKAVPILQDFPQLSIPIRVDCELFRNNWRDGEELKLEWNK